MRQHYRRTKSRVKGEAIKKSVFAALALAILVLAVFGIAELKGVFERWIESRLLEKISDGDNIAVEVKSKEGVKEDLVTATFCDLFSGAGWLDASLTTMYQDMNAGAFLFPPKIDFVKANEVGAPIQETKPEIKDLSLPPEIISKNIISSAIKKLQNKWAVGIVTNEAAENIYNGYIFVYDGNKLTSHNGTFRSKYKGVFSFGGSDNDFIALYGAYESIAYRVRNQELINISSFFPTRIISSDLTVEIVKAAAAAGTADWYVSSISPKLIKFIKLFGNRSGDIIGVADLTNQFYQATGAEAVLRMWRGQGDKARIETKNQEGDYFWEVRDYGFDKNSEVKIISGNISPYPFVTRSAKLYGVELAKDESRVSFYISNDNENWEPAEANKEIVFSNREGQSLYWRADFAPGPDSKTSPFFNSLCIEFKRVRP